jgi:heptosyltransferase-3
LKVLVTRTDRLGDLVLSLPVLSCLKKARPDWSIQALVALSSVPVVENDPSLDRIWTWDGGREQDRSELMSALREEGFSASVMLHYDHELAGLLKKAGIRRRHGPLSKLGSWFRLNRGTIQNRSRCRSHETEYNLQLARRLLGRGHRADCQEMDPVLTISAGQRQQGLELRRELAPAADTVVFVHPGSGGSALDWEPERFAGVANSLAALEGFAVFITGAGGDAAMVEGVRALLDPRVQVMLDRFGLRDFLGFLAAGDLMIAPSTGPLHLAAALDVAAVGIYPPVPTMSPSRWGPRGELARALVPEVECPSRRFCFKERCRHHNCLTRVFERDVLDMALALVKQRENRVS